MWTSCEHLGRVTMNNWQLNLWKLKYVKNIPVYVCVYVLVIEQTSGQKGSGWKGEGVVGA